MIRQNTHSKMAFLFFAFLLQFSLIIAEERPLLKIEQGELLGEVWQSQNGRPFNAFISIPYAEPPIGKLRFKSPVRASGWSGIRDSKNYSQVVCAQMNFMEVRYKIIGDICICHFRPNLSAKLNNKIIFNDFDFFGFVQRQSYKRKSFPRMRYRPNMKI